MGSQETLKKAIQKAVDGGWKPECMYDFTNFKASIRLGQGFVRWFNDEGMEVIENVERVIFNHDFAKALWPSGYCVCGELHNRGEVIVMEPGNTTLHSALPDWQYHLQRMVVAEDPIKYLGEHLNAPKTHTTLKMKIKKTVSVGSLGSM